MVEKEKQAKPGYNNTLSDFNSTTKFTSDDDYNPFEHREVDKPNSTTGSLVHLLKSFLGTGVLAMPMAFKNAGLLFGGIGTIIVGLICTHCIHILVQTSHDICKKTKVPVLGFAETIERVVEFGPRKLRKYSAFAKAFVDSTLMAAYYGACSVYIVFIAASIRGVINFEYNLDWSVRIYICIVVIPVLILGQIRVLKYLVPFMAIANIFVIIAFAITLYYMFNVPLKFADKPLFVSWRTLPLFFSTAIFSMEGIGLVMPVENEMKNPQHFLGCPGVLNVAMGTIIVSYSAIGFFGYVRFGDSVLGSITLNLPEGELLAQIAQILIALSIFFTFGLQFYVPNEIVWRRVAHQVPKEKHNITQTIIRSVTIIILAGIGIVVPNLELFISLIGAIFFSILGLFVPCLVETIFQYPIYGPSNWRLWKNVILMIFAIFALITGALVSIKDIVKIYTGEGH